MIKSIQISRSQKGNLLIIVFLVLGVVFFIVLFMTSGSYTFFQNAQYNYKAEQAISIAEAGIDKAIASLNATWGSYSGETETFFGEGSYSVTIENKAGNIKIITATGYIPSKINNKVKRIISIQALGTGSTFSLVKGTYQAK